ncbi:MAG: peptide deformylase [Alphaproteobacteria bacterium]|jgi:peptide deformylase|nr:peptide deformylase [Alphaproteobacteria bacterium]
MFDKSKLKTDIALVIAPSPILMGKAKEVTEFTPKLKDYLDDMSYMLKSVDGLGLAGPQANLDMRMFIVDRGLIETIDDNEPKSEMIYIVNPVIKKLSDKKCSMNEGCLSLPDIYYDVERAEEVEIEYQNEKGEKQTLKANGLLGRCILHEIDHLEGVLFIDHLSNLKRKLSLTKMEKIKKRLLKNQENQGRIK